MNLNIDMATGTANTESKNAAAELISPVFVDEFKS